MQIVQSLQQTQADGPDPRFRKRLGAIGQNLLQGRALHSFHHQIVSFVHPKMVDHGWETGMAQSFEKFGLSGEELASLLHLVERKRRVIEFLDRPNGAALLGVSSQINSSASSFAQHPLQTISAGHDPIFQMNFPRLKAFGRSLYSPRPTAIFPLLQGDSQGRGEISKYAQ